MIVYKHRRLDNNQVFYVGIGKTSKRAYSKHKRNKYWQNIVNKVGYNVEIIYQCSTWEEACNLEKELISKYGRKDNNTGILCNMTDGGDGTIGIIYSKERNLKISKSHKGKKLSNVSKKRLSDSRKGIKFTEDHKLKLSKSKSKPVLMFKEGEFLKRFCSIKQASKEMFLHSNGIVKVCKGEHSQTGGFVFKYE